MKTAWQTTWRLLFVLAVSLALVQPASLAQTQLPDELTKFSGSRDRIDMHAMLEAIESVDGAQITVSEDGETKVKVWVDNEPNGRWVY